MRPLLLLVLAAGCASNTVLPERDRDDLAGRVHGKRQFLAVSMYAGPFFREAGKQLLSPAPFSELRLLEGPGGAPISPGAEEQVWPAGTEVRVREVEFPTGLAVIRRPFLTPRYHPWVMLEVVSVPPLPPPRESPVWILVLRDGIETPEAFWSEWSRYLADEPPRPLATLSPELRKAVAQKEARVGMSGDVLQIAWGWPTKKIFAALDQGVRREEWLWIGGERRALLEDGRVIQVWPREGTAAVEPSPKG